MSIAECTNLEEKRFRNKARNIHSHKFNTNMETEIYKQKTNKRKKKDKIKPYKIKSLQNTLEFVFLLASYSWAWGLPWNVVNILSKTTMEKTNISFVSVHQLCIRSWLGIGAHVKFPFKHWDPVWFPPDIFCKCTFSVSVIKVSVKSYVYQFSCVLRTLQDYVLRF